MRSSGRGARLGRGVLAAAALMWASGCQCAPEGDRTPSAPKPKESAAPAPAAPHTLLELPEKAYGVTLDADGDLLYLLTPSAAYRIEPGGAAARTPLALGSVAAVTPDAFVFWAEGALRSVPKAGGEPRRLVAIDRMPQIVLAAGDRHAWVERTPGGGDVVRTSTDGKARSVYAAEQAIVAARMHGTQIFFVEDRKPAWRLGVVSVDGGTPAFGATHSGRAPAMLAAGDGVFYYDGPRRSVLRASPDLASEYVVADHFICSPIAVSTSVLCAQTGGLFELGLTTPTRRLLTSSLGGPVTAMVAAKSGFAWVNDSGKSGEDRLSLKWLPR